MEGRRVVKAGSKIKHFTINTTLTRLTVGGGCGGRIAFLKFLSPNKILLCPSNLQGASRKQRPIEVAQVKLNTSQWTVVLRV